ncbi:MAG: ABC transporter ATP-binding protein [Thermoleophilia bacterium]
MAADTVLAIEGLALDARIRRAIARPVAEAHVEVRAGEIVGLVGESGSGKTLTALSALRLLPDNIEIAAGRIEVGGQDVRALDDAGLAALRGSVAGMVFQDPIGSLNPSMTIGRQVAEGVRIHQGVDRAAAAARAVEALGLVGFPHARERFDAYPHQLSGGLRQRVMIAMAIANEPRLVIADEPTTALDVTVQAQILELLQSLVAELGIGVLLITHDLGVIANAADRVTVMYGGRTVEQCSTLHAFGDMRHPYTEALVASAPTLEGSEATVLRGIPGAPPDPTRPEPGCPFAPRCTRVTAECTVVPPAYEEIGEGRSLACIHPVPAAAHA